LYFRFREYELRRGQDARSLQRPSSLSERSQL
jgi:hypothetical protein